MLSWYRGNKASLKKPSERIEESLIHGLPNEIPVHEIYPNLSLNDKVVLSRVNRLFFRSFGSIVLQSSPLEYYCRHGYLELLKWDQSSSKPSALSPKLFEKACEGGHIEIYEYLLQINCPLQNNAFNLAAENGHKQMIRHFLEKDASLTPALLESAIRTKRAGVLEVIIESPLFKNYGSLTHLASVGSKRVLEKAMKSLKLSTVDTSTFSKILETGRMDLIKWAMGHGAKFNEDICTSIAISGKVETFSLAQEVFPISYETVNATIESGQLELLKKMLERSNQDLNWYTSSFIYAARLGRIDIMEYGLKAGVDILRSMTWRYAAESGNVELVRYLDEKGCPLPDLYLSFRHSIQQKHFDMAIYIVESGFDYTSGRYILIEAAASGKDSLKLFKYLIEKKGRKLTLEEVLAALGSNDLELIEYVLQHCETDFSETLLSSLIDSDLPIHDDVIVYLHRKGIKCDSDHVFHIILKMPLPPLTYKREGNISRFQLRILMKMGLKCLPKYAIQAAKYTRFDLLTWLYDVGCEIDYEELAAVKIHKNYITPETHRALTQWIQNHPSKSMKMVPCCPPALQTQSKRVWIRPFLFLLVIVLILAVWLCTYCNEIAFLRGVNRLK